MAVPSPADGLRAGRGEAATVPGVSNGYRYRSGERLPVEVMVFEVDPDHVEEFLTVDHEVWTLGEAYTEGFDHVPFLSKEVWLDDAHPGRIILTFVWESIESWRRVGDEHLQQTLQARFDQRFPHPVTLLRALHEESDFGIHRVSRFERTDPAGVTDATDRSPRPRGIDSQR